MNKSIWSAAVESLPFPGEEDTENFETVIVGAGIAGMTAAYRLVNEGKRVLLIHAGDLSDGQTSRSTAQINTVHDDGWKAMLDLHGHENLKLCYQSYQEAFSFIKNLCEKENLNCFHELVPAYLFAAESEKNEKWYEEEIEAAEAAGVQDVSIVNEVPGVKGVMLPALKYENQAQFNPQLYINGIVKKVADSGPCRIWGKSQVESVEESDAMVELRLEDGRKISCSRLILATNVPIHRALFPIEGLAAYRSYVAVMKAPKGLLPDAQYWDNGDPYHYVRKIIAGREKLPPEFSEEGYDFFLVGGEDHRTGQAEDPAECYDKIIKWAKKHLEGVIETGIHWSAQTIETFDGMPMIGSSSKTEGRIYIVTGDSGTGITHGTLGGILTSEKILGRDTAWSKLYAPARNRFKSISRWSSENFSSILGYQDWVTPGDVKEEEEIKPGSGAVLRDGLKKVAVFRKEDGSFIRLCATCPHLEAIVRWNDDEKSWDCPAHGSRFSPDGRVLNGPACTPLTAGPEESVELQEERQPS